MYGVTVIYCICNFWFHQSDKGRENKIIEEEKEEKSGVPNSVMNFVSVQPKFLRCFGLVTVPN